MKLNLGKGLVLAGVIFGLTPYAVFADEAMTTESAPAATTTETTTTTTTTHEAAEPAKKAKKAKKPAKKQSSGKKHHHKKKKCCDENNPEPVSALEAQEKTAAAEQASELAAPAPTTATE